MLTVSKLLSVLFQMAHRFRACQLCDILKLSANKIEWFVSMSCLGLLFEFHTQHPGSSPVNHSDIQFRRIDELPLVCHFYLSWCPFLHPWLSLSLHSDIANYFNLSGRQFHFQLKLVFSSDLGVENRVALSALNSSSGSYGCHLRRNLNSIWTWLYWIHTRCVHPCQDRSVHAICIPVIPLMW